MDGVPVCISLLWKFMLNFPFRMLNDELKEPFFPAASLSPLGELAQQKAGLSCRGCLVYLTL